MQFTTDAATNEAASQVLINVYKLQSGYYLIDDVVLEKVESEITLDTTSADVEVGKTAELTATLSGIDSFKNSTVTWTSSDENVVTVAADSNDSKKATVTGVAEGTATITATAKDTNGVAGADVTATCTVNVKAASVDVQSISMQDKQVLYVNDSETLEVTFEPTGATNQTLTWSSSDSEVASVDATGKVTGVAVGTATITATSANGKSATCAITVTERGLLINGDFERKAGSLSTSSMTSNNVYIVNEAAAWYGSKYKVVDSADGTTPVEMVYSIGTIDGYDGGNALKIAKGESVGADVLVSRGWVYQNVTLEPSTTYALSAQVKPVGAEGTGRYIELKVDKNGSGNVKYNVTDSNNNPWTELNMQFTTDAATNEAATQVLINVYKLQSGYYLIDNVVLEKVEPEISLDQTATVQSGKTIELTATVTDPNSIVDAISWSSNDTEVASVDTNGTVTGLKAGTATITATIKNSKNEDVKATCTVTVTETETDTDTGIVTMPNMLINGDFEAIAGELVHPHGAANKAVYIVDGDNASDVAWKATWHWYAEGNVVKHTVGTIDGYDGGMALKISKDDTMAADASIKRAVIFQNINYEADTTYIFKAKVKAVGVTGASSPYIALSVENPSGTNVELCKVTATDAGNDWYWLEGEYTFSSACKKAARINVYDLKSGYWLVDDVSLSRKPEEPKAVITLDSAEVSNVAVEIGKTAQLTAEMYDPDNVLGDATVTFSWSSADTSVATVDETGCVMAVGLGKTMITANSADGKYTVACEITVTEVFVAVESISIAKSELNLCTGGQEKLEATITPVNATEQTLTWTSSAPSVASVATDGTVTGLSAGTATITATTTNGKTATCTVNVSVSTALTTTPAALETDFGTPLTGDLSSNVTNNTGSTATYKLFAAPENGDMTVNADGTYTYVPHATSDTASDSFVVLVTAGEESAVLSGSITIGSLSDSITENLVSGTNLLFSQEELDNIKAAIATEGSFQNEIWARYQSYLEGLLASTPTAYYQNGVDEWQRSGADNLVCLLIGYLVTGEEAYKNKCLEYAETIAEYDYWGVDEYWKQAELAAGHNAFALGLVYDWMKDDMSKELRDTILKRLYYACQCFEVSWDSRELYMHNHTWICMTGLASATMAIYLDADYAIDVIKGDSDIDAAANSVGNNVPDYDLNVTEADLRANCERWLALVLDQIGSSYEWMPEDGTNHEGAGYAEYGTEWLLKASLLLEHNLGIDTFTGNGYLENHSEFFLNTIYPANSLSASGSLINYADGARENWYGPTGHMRVLAAKYQDETAQWIAEVMEDRDATGSRSFWMGLIWGDGNVEAKLDPEKSTLYYSEDMGLAVVRSDWSGDESLLFMRSGLPLGKEGNGLLTISTNEYHVDPDCNAILLYANGENLLKSGGYTWKKTGNNSTLLINGAGQIGEGAKGLVGDAFVTYDYEPTMTIVEDADTYSYFVGDATEAYAPTANLSKFQRNVVFLKEENVVLVVDDIKSTQNSELELRWFPESKTVVESYGIYSVYGTNNTMNFYPFNTMNSEDNNVVTAFKGADTHDVNGKLVSEMALIQNYTGTAWQNAVAFSWTPNGEVATQVKYEAGNANEHKFEVNGKIYTLNVSANTLTVEEGSLNQVNEWDADSALTNILFNQEALEEFDSTSLTQDVERFWKTKEVTITAVPKSTTATAVVDWDGNCPGTATITCTSGDKSSTTTYTINLKNDNGLLSIESASSTPNTSGISETFTYDNYIQTDGNTDRTWSSQQLPVITYDMGSLVDISKIDVAFNSSRKRETYYNMLISQDGETWTPVQDDATAGITSADLRLSEYQTIYEGEALRAQFVRFELRGHTNEASKDSTTAYNSIQEISFYGAVVVSDTDSDTDSDIDTDTDTDTDTDIDSDSDTDTNTDIDTDSDTDIDSDSSSDTSDNADDNTGDITDDNDDDNTGDDAGSGVEPEATVTQSVAAPTGDSSNTGLWIMLMVVSIAGIAAMFVIKRRKN